MVIAQDNFAVQVQAVDAMTFIGKNFSFNLGDADNSRINESDIFNENDDGGRPPTASLTLPPNLFSSVNATNNTRITNTVYTNDVLFIRRNPQKVVGSIIVSASIPGVQVVDLDPALSLLFSLRAVRYNELCCIHF